MPGPALLAQSNPTPNEETFEELARLSSTDWLIAAAIIAGSILVGLGLRALLLKPMRRRFGHLVAGLLGRLIVGAAVGFGLVYALNEVGVSMSPLLGLLGLVGLALALAFQDVLSNFIAGVMLSTRRPFRVGDEVSTADYEGVVEDVTMRSVTLHTYDGVRVIIPNSTVWDGAIENFTVHGSRRTTLELGVGYDTDLDQAKRTILATVESVDGVTRSPEALVHAFGESSIDLAIRFWHEPGVADEWQVRDEVARVLKRELDRSGVDIPFPQVVVHSEDGRSDGSDPVEEP